MLKMIKKRWYRLLILFIVIGGIFFYLSSKNDKTKTLKSYKLKRQNIEEILSLSGEIDADEKATLRFQTSGRLAWVGVKEGDYVKKYQGIASLDQRSLKKTLEKTLRDYANERLDHDEDLDVTYKDQPLTSTVRRVLEKNQYDLEQAVLDVELDSIALEYSYLYTPIEGVITTVNAPYAGVNITPTTAEFIIVNPKTVYFLATADQNDVVKVKTGMKGKIIFDSYPEEEIDGEVNYISFSPKAGETTTSYKIKINIPQSNEVLKYRLEMTGDVDFVTKTRKNILAIPDQYVSTENEKKYVLKKVNGKPTKTPITLGDEIDGSVEIISGLQEGDIIYD